FEGYTEDAYEKFKEASLISATVLNTNSKFGCENEFALFIECKNESELYLPDLAQYVKFYKEDEMGVIDLTQLGFLLKEKIRDEIHNVEIYYNPYTTKLISTLEKLNVKYINIYTKEVVE